MPLTGSEQIAFEEDWFGAADAVARVLPGVEVAIRWDTVFELEGLWIEFNSGSKRLTVDVICYEREFWDGDIDFEKLDPWARGAVSFSPDGRPDDPDASERLPNLWRTAVLEEFAAAIRARWPKGAAELRNVAEFLRPPPNAG